MPLFRSYLLMVQALLLCAACAPDTTLRRTALIPAASAPARAGGEVSPGSARLMGHVNAVNFGDEVAVEHLFPAVGDPGVLIPDLTLGGSAYFGLGSGLELGVQFQFASMDWAHPNAVGVLRFPAGTEEDLWMGGVGGRYNVGFEGSEVGLAIVAELNYAVVPQAVFRCEVCDDPDDIVVGPDSQIYDFLRIDKEDFMLPNLALQVSYPLMAELMGYAMIGGQQSVTNVGFDNDLANLPSSTLETFWVGYFGLGFEARIQAFVANLTFYVPVESVDLIDFGPSLAFSVGGVID